MLRHCTQEAHSQDPVATSQSRRWTHGTVRSSIQELDADTTRSATVRGTAKTPASCPWQHVDPHRPVANTDKEEGDGVTWVNVAGAAVTNQELTKILISGPCQGLRGRAMAAALVHAHGVEGSVKALQEEQEQQKRWQEDEEEGVGRREWT